MANILHSSIKNREEIVNSLGTEKDVVHLSFGINDSYARGMGIAVFSVLENNPDLRFHVHLFGTALSNESISRIIELAKMFPLAVTTYTFKDEAFQGLPMVGRYTHAIYYRLFIPLILADITDKVIYLDADTLCVGRYNDLIKLDISQYTLCAVNDEKRARAKLCPVLKLTSGNYFNSGFLYINIEKWVARDTTNRVINELRENGDKFKFPDQEALNVVLEHETLLLPKEYNYIVDIIYKRVGHEKTLPGGVILIHYTGKCKPWHSWGGSKVADLYYSYYQRSPWRGISLDMPVSYKEMKRYARVLWFKGDYLSSVKWMAKYMNTKVFRKRTHD